MASGYEVQVTISSAKDLKNVNWRHGPVIPYAVVWVDRDNKLTTRVDEFGDTNPTWNQKLVIPIKYLIEEDTTLYVDIVHHAGGGEGSSKDLIGSARLKLRDVIDDVGVGGSSNRTLALKRPSGRPHGKLDVEVTIREQPVYGAPPPPAPYSVPYGAPPQQNHYYYAAPPVGYPSGGYSVAAPPQYGGQVQGQGGGYYGEGEEKKKFGMGTGLAVGAVAGVLGGLALSEGIDAIEDKIADDVAERIEDDLDDDYY